MDVRHVLDLHIILGVHVDMRVVHLIDEWVVLALLLALLLTLLLAVLLAVLLHLSWLCLLLLRFFVPRNSRYN